MSFEQDANGVTAQVVKHDGSSDVPETVHASYVVGAEGARSKFPLFPQVPVVFSLKQLAGVVRKQLGFTFEGETRPANRILISDMEVTGISDEVNHYQLTMLFPS